MRAAERCTGVTNAVCGAADGAPMRAERALPLMGLRGGEAGKVGWFEKSIGQMPLASLAGQFSSGRTRAWRCGPKNLLT
jgi:hypothetical protein